MMEITSKQRKVLEKAAAPLNPIVIIGKNGISDEVEAQILACFKSHELIKIKFNEFKDERRELSEAIAQKMDAVLVRIVGFVAIFYKQNEDPEKRTIKLS